MIIDNIIVIVVAIILITYLSINYVKKYVPGNLILISITAFSLGLYLPVVFYNVYLRIRYQIPLSIGIFFLPCIFAILQYSNISFGGIYINATEDGQDKILDLNGNEMTDGYVYKMYSYITKNNKYSRKK